VVAVVQVQEVVAVVQVQEAAADRPDHPSARQAA
jgi:hypothetical protein